MDRLLKSTDVMAILSIKKGKLKELVAKRKIFPLPDFARWKFSEEEICSYILSQREKSKNKSNFFFKENYMNEEMKFIIKGDKNDK